VGVRKCQAIRSFHSSRRYAEKALKYDKRKAGTILALYSELYKIEARIKGLSEEEVLAARQTESRPILNRIKELYAEWQLKTPPKTTLGIAINCSPGQIGQVVPLYRACVLEDGHQPCGELYPSDSLWRAQLDAYWRRRRPGNSFNPYDSGKYLQALDVESVPIPARCSS
jgi:Transposase IS66 family